MSLLFDPTTDRKRRHRVVRKKHTKHKPDLSRRVVHAKKTEPNFDSLIYSIGELPVFVELGIEYDDELEKDTRPPTLTFEMLRTPVALSSLVKISSLFLTYRANVL